jgi:hypothetical protein
MGSVRRDALNRNGASMRSRSRRTPSLLALAVPCVALLSAAAAPAADWPWWRGPNHDGKTDESGWLANWPDGGDPPVAWRRADIGVGHSPMSVVWDAPGQGRDYIMGRSADGKGEVLFCLDPTTGATLWTYSYTGGTASRSEKGPRGAPTIDAGRAYVLGERGRAACVDALTGKELWVKQFPWGDSSGSLARGEYGYCTSLVPVGDYLVMNGGTNGTALRKSDGSVVWGNDGVQGGCCSPVPYQVGGTQYVAIFSHGNVNDTSSANCALLGVDMQGRRVWSLKWDETYAHECSDPLAYGGKVWCTTAHKTYMGARVTHGSGALTADWTTDKLCCDTQQVVLCNGYIYGVRGGGRVGNPGYTSEGRLTAIDWDTGAQGGLSQTDFGQYGTLICADGKLLIQTYKNRDDSPTSSISNWLVVVEARPDTYVELRRTRVFEGHARTWTMPVLSGGYVFCRNWKGEVVCFDLTGGGAPAPTRADLDSEIRDRRDGSSTDSSVKSLIKAYRGQ